MNPYERPGIFPPWTGHLRNPRDRDIEIARQRGGWLIAGLISAMIWVAIFGVAVAIVKGFP